ncbi:hypothetical protein IFM47457_08189 [Aspergillus lentulus]|nr:hypothetical protein IFM47457_08189 [Aspergillus lentulus]
MGKERAVEEGYEANTSSLYRRIIQSGDFLGGWTSDDRESSSWNKKTKRVRKPGGDGFVLADGDVCQTTKDRRAMLSGPLQD